VRARQRFLSARVFTRRRLVLATDALKHGAFLMASGEDWLALLGPDKDFVPIEPWGRDRSPKETARVNGEWDNITGDTFGTLPAISTSAITPTWMCGIRMMRAPSMP